MKKSFKKAGAAVLSMAMLLSMGAISMPVYAELDPHETIVPTQVAVTIAKSGDNVNGGNANGTGSVALQDDDFHKYDYLKDVNEATVTMYRVATLTGANWAWESGIDSALPANVQKDFAKLLEKTLDGTTVDETGTATSPFMKSEDLQALAGALQQVVLSANTTGNGGTVTNPYKIAENTIHKVNGGWETIYLPTDDKLFDNGGVKNVIGYYLLVTNTDEAGYVMQPVLVPISNKKNEAVGQRSVKTLSLKGVNVSVDKTIVDIATRVDSNDEVMQNDGEAAATYVSRANISTDGKDGIIDADDVIRYVIKADVPKYSKNATELEYVIEDLPDDGIEVISRIENSKYVTGAQTSTDDATNPVRNGKIVVTYSTDAALNTSADNIVLDEYTDYIVGPATGDTTTKKGFKITFNQTRLRGMGTSNTSTSNSTKLDGKTMEGGHIFVEFYAKTNEKFNSAYAANDALNPAPAKTSITLKDIEEQLDAVNNGVTEATVTLATGTDKYTTAELEALEVGTGATVADLAGLYAKAGWTAPTTSPAADNDLAKMQTAAYLAWSKAKRDNDAANELIKQNNYDKNGTENTAKLGYNKLYTGGSEKDEVEDKTQLFSVKLDLTKYRLDNNVKNAPSSKKYHVSVAPTSTAAECQSADLTVSPVTVTGPATPATGAKQEGTDYVYMKANAARNGVSTWETTTDITEAVYQDSTDSKYYVKYLTADLETDLDSGINDGATSPNDVYVKNGTTYMTTNDVSQAKPDTNTDPHSYVDDIQHSQPVAGAVFKLEESYTEQSTSNGRVNGTNGKHARSLAITDKNGKMWQLEVDNAAATAVPDVKDMETATAGDIVYYAKNEGGTTYTTYKLTEKPAWDRVGEGTYFLTEEHAPTGYKKWGAPVTITITDAGIEGNFAGTVTSDRFWDHTTDAQGSATTAHDLVFDAGTMKNDILNNPDDTLPATGGIGTVLFTAGGISIVLIAGALFVMYMKKRNSEEEE